MTPDIFESARKNINSGIIEITIKQIDQKAIKSGNNWLSICPLHKDTNPSLSINADTGLFKCFGCGESGDFIDLISKINSISKKEAAEKILQMSGLPVPETPKKDKKKIDAVIPVPKEALKKLNTFLNLDFIVNKSGPAVAGWQYKDKNGNTLFCTARHEKNGNKSVKPYFYGKDHKWHPGNPFNNNVPLYGLDRLSEAPVLIAEGEKCADLEIPGFTLISWCGGTGQVQKADWTPLRDKKIIIWPDNDEPGLKAAIQIKNILPQSIILKIENKPDKWDIYDARQEGVDLNDFIKNCAEYIPSEELEEIAENNNMHFRFMGYDEAYHYFLPQGSRIIKRISQGGFGLGKLLELAPLSFYNMQFPKKIGFSQETAIDWLIRNSEAQGFFKPDSVRGTGVWLDEEKIIINNGSYIVNGTGAPIKNYNGKYFYVKSDRKMGNFDGDISTDEQGKNLIELFQAQGFENKLESWIVCGWSLIAPFAGILNWRPHIWITGPTQSGKSFLLREIIHPICGPMSEIGTGKTSAPGIYRALKNSAAPVILDEMEPGKNKESRMRIEDKLEIARNASSDFSANMSLASKNGGVDRFCIRSPFCFSSVIPYFMNEAIENRILICRLKNFNSARNKREKTREILKTGLLKDPGIFRRRIYKNIDLLIKNTNEIRKVIIKEMSDNRRADNLSAIMAALFLIFDIKEFSEQEIKDVIVELINSAEVEVFESDEDKLITQILDYQVKTYSNEFISIAELILANTDMPSEEQEKLLWRHGLKIFTENFKKYLAIAKNHMMINKILENTQYQGRYNDILKRHPALYNNSQTIRFAGQSKTAIILDWPTVEEKYFTEHDEKTMEISF